MKSPYEATFDVLPFEELHTAIEYSGWERSAEMLGTDIDDMGQVHHLLMSIIDGQLVSIGGKLVRRESHPPQPVGTYSRYLKAAKQISAYVVRPVEVVSSAFDTRPAVAVTAETDTEPILRNALQIDQYTYSLALQNHKFHLGEEGWEWTKDYADELLGALDRYYDLSGDTHPLKDLGNTA